MHLIKVLLISISWFFALHSHAQSFEGTITVSSKGAEKPYTVNIFGNKSMVYVETDSTESLTMIRNHTTEVSTVLKRKGDMKYGFSKHKTFDSDHLKNEKFIIPENTSYELTTDTQTIAGYRCAKLLIGSREAAAEAWITKEIPLHLSEYVPQLLGGDMHPDMIPLRQIADRHGFIMSYQETLYENQDQSSFRVNVDAREISSDLFNVTSQYLVLDEESMKRLYMESQTDPSRKKQWEEFQSLFGK